MQVYVGRPYTDKNFSMVTLSFVGCQTSDSRALSSVDSCRAWLTCCLRAYRKATWKVVRALWRILTL